MDNTDQAMRVKLIDEETGNVVVDGSTEDHDERNVHLDSIDVSSRKTYQVVYEFYEKNVGIRSFEDKTISGGHMGAMSCSKPFVAQELAIVSKDLIAARARRYKDMKQSAAKDDKKQVEEKDISHLGEYCDFKTLDNAAVTLDRGESGLYCDKKTFSYRPQDRNADELVVVY
jgi:tRNA isopentenyl-2-thiomethyl-A-37 hydroxylase MiaE